MPQVINNCPRLRAFVVVLEVQSTKKKEPRKGQVWRKGYTKIAPSLRYGELMFASQTVKVTEHWHIISGIQMYTN